MALSVSTGLSFLIVGYENVLCIGIPCKQILSNNIYIHGLGHVTKTLKVFENSNASQFLLGIIHYSSISLIIYYVQMLK